MQQPFSWAWVIVSVALFTVFEVLIGRVIAPWLAGAFVSPMLDTRVIMMLHLGSFLVGGFTVGVVSPRVRLYEPAVAAFVAVLLVWLYSFFVPGPSWFYGASWTKLAVSGGIAFAIALWGAWVGEKLMGNVGKDTPAGRMREKLWGPGGNLAGGRDDWLR
jgi:hypothetical protein